MNKFSFQTLEIVSGEVNEPYIDFDFSKSIFIGKNCEDISELWGHSNCEQCGHCTSGKKDRCEKCLKTMTWSLKDEQEKKTQYSNMVNRINSTSLYAYTLDNIIYNSQSGNILFNSLFTGNIKISLDALNILSSKFFMLSFHLIDQLTSRVREQSYDIEKIKYELRALGRQI